MQGKTFLILFFLIIVLSGVVFMLYGNKYAVTQPYYQKIFGDKAQKIVTAVSTVDKLANKEIIEPPASENDWCRLQNIKVPEDRETYAKDEIIGWDSIEQCCVRRFSGFNCALLRESSVEYCFTGNVGGEIKWTIVEGFFIDNNKRQAFINDLMKENIPGKPCSYEKYPKLIQPVNAIDYNNLTNASEVN